ncbi:MAG: hypothetical protein ACYCSX_15295 [Acidimicrobiales bacterium]
MCSIRHSPEGALSYEPLGAPLFVEQIYVRPGAGRWRGRPGQALPTPSGAPDAIIVEWGR